MFLIKAIVLLFSCVIVMVAVGEATDPTRTDAEMIEFYRDAVTEREERKREQEELTYWMNKYKEM